jgi:protein-tyrosine-phosphatase
METRMFSPIVSRRKLILTGAALALIPTSPAAACDPVRVLFVCPAGSVKSAIAREALKRLAADERVPVSLASRGLIPEDHLSPALAANLKKDGLDPATEPLRKLTPSDVSDADIVIAFDDAVDEPMLRSARGWKTPSWNEQYGVAKADLDARLAGLLAELRQFGEEPCRLRLTRRTRLHWHSRNSVEGSA